MKKVLLMATAGLVCLFAGSSLFYADDTDFTEGKCSDDFGNDQFVEDSVVDYYGFEDMKDVQKMNFRYAYPEVIWSAEFGEVEDNSDEDDNTESNC